MAVAADGAATPDRVANVMAMAVRQYLSRTETLLVGVRAGDDSDAFAGLARDLLGMTRLLLDSESLTDPATRESAARPGTRPGTTGGVALHQQPRSGAQPDHGQPGRPQRDGPVADCNSLPPWIGPGRLRRTLNMSRLPACILALMIPVPAFTAAQVVAPSAQLHGLQLHALELHRAAADLHQTRASLSLQAFSWSSPAAGPPALDPDFSRIRPTGSIGRRAKRSPAASIPRRLSSSARSGRATPARLILPTPTTGRPLPSSVAAPPKACAVRWTCWPSRPNGTPTPPPAKTRAASRSGSRARWRVAAMRPARRRCSSGGR